MAMDFWEAQRRARSRTTFFLIIFTLLTLGVATISELAMREFAGPDYGGEGNFPYVGLSFLALTFVVALFQYGMFSSQGGSYVAESLGAYRLEAEGASPKEKQLLNIVEEMAIAASLPVPPVYLLEAKEINAFAAGLNSSDAIITVTYGCLDRLNREELQGVIGHELGHIYNGDMLISMRLAAMLMGFFIIINLGLRILQFSSWNDNNDREKKNGNPVLIAALILVVAGAFTWFVGSILKCLVSQQREYLADASSVQFTRNPEGLANALRKIANLKVSDMPKNGISYSHMYLEDHSFFSSLFATHPPIEKRIATIENNKREN